MDTELDADLSSMQRWSLMVRKSLQQPKITQIFYLYITYLWFDFDLTGTLFSKSAPPFAPCKAVYCQYMCYII